MLRHLLLLAFAAVLCGCVDESARQVMPEATAADYGTPINQESGEKLAETLISATLKDPMSAVYKWEHVEKGWTNDGQRYMGPQFVGYVLEGTVNAKNSFGGYTGATNVRVTFHDGSIAAAFIADGPGPYRTSIRLK